MRITLTVTEGVEKGRAFTFAGHETFLVGRSRRAHLQLAPGDRYCSRFHFLVETNPPHCRLMDLGSNNGTHVNGRRVPSAELEDGDEIRAGRSVLRVRVEGGTTAETFEPTAAAVEEVDATEGQASAAAWPVRLSVCPGCGSAMLPDENSATVIHDRAATAWLCLACRQLELGQPQPIGGYRILRPLGQGGMGVVWLAVRLADQKCYALKTITPAVAPTPTQLGRFLREARILQQLAHPHVVAFRDMGQCGEQLYFAMDYVAGNDLGRLLKIHDRFPVGRAVGWVCQLLEALEYAHNKGFVHRDVKPTNVMLSATQKPEAVRLIDFGLARVYQASQLSGLTVMGEMGGTPAYTAPEQVINFRDVRPAADLYSTAATLYHLLTGCHVYDFPAETHRRLSLILNEDPIPIRQRRADLPRPLAAAIDRCLQRLPSQRFADARSLRAALLPFSSPIA